MKNSSDPIKESHFPSSLVSDLQSVLIYGKTVDESGNEARGGDGQNPLPAEEEKPQATSSSPKLAEPPSRSKPVVLVTNGDGISSPGLTFLVDAIVRVGRYDVHVYAPDSNKSTSGHSVSLGETLAASSVEINGTTAFQLSGTPADCVSLALSGVLFPWSRPTLGAVRRLNSQRKNVEIESVAASGKPETEQVVKKNFRMEFLVKEQRDADDDDLDYNALENGYIALTPIDLNLSRRVRDPNLCSRLACFSSPK